ncbi:unnamed protein product [Phyllotreta striolata]|uniref:Uncharacterized protein n=1 Tax=Phyllotreta striolata TaxID=444603 RepID=A0A9N9U0V2_PHYSR|nr:unnamed protein product [Phyllotreta striolata]
MRQGHDVGSLETHLLTFKRDANRPIWVRTLDKLDCPVGTILAEDQFGPIWVRTLDKLDCPEGTILAEDQFGPIWVRTLDKLDCPVGTILAEDQFGLDCPEGTIMAKDLSKDQIGIRPACPEFKLAKDIRPDRLKTPVCLHQSLDRLQTLT